MSGAPQDGGEVLEALASRPGGPQLLRLGRKREDIALVGGAVRDLLLGRAPRELDVVVEGEAEPFARELAETLGAQTTVHERFGTAVVQWEAGRVDIARRRAESYPEPGALPEVSAGSVEQDLLRRDFTVNAIAVALGGERRGQIDSAEHALEDLAAARLRVLHERSFIDDPTRLLRLARYRARLGFQVEAHTAELSARAVSDGALATVSRARIGAELRLALREPDAPAALESIDRLGLLAALHPNLRFDGTLARAALELLALAHAAGTRVTRPDLLLLAALVQPRVDPLGETAERETRQLLDALEFLAPEQELALHAALGADALLDGLARAQSASQVHLAASRASLEGVALAGAGERPGAHAEAMARWWLADLSHVRLLIDGHDLLGAGVPEGPEIGRRLQAALLRKLDRQLDGSGEDAELRAALEGA